MTAPGNRGLVQIRARSSEWTPRRGVPATRADCVDLDRRSSGCPYIACRYHLWRVDTDDQPGPHAATQPRDLRADAPWLPDANGNVLPSCALDVAARVKPGDVMRMVDIAAVLRRHPRRIKELVERARKRATVPQSCDRGHDYIALPRAPCPRCGQERGKRDPQPIVGADVVLWARIGREERARIKNVGEKHQDGLQRRAYAAAEVRRAALGFVYREDGIVCR